MDYTVIRFDDEEGYSVDTDLHDLRFELIDDMECLYNCFFSINDILDIYVNDILKYQNISDKEIIVNWGVMPYDENLPVKHIKIALRSIEDFEWRPYYLISDEIDISAEGIRFDTQGFSEEEIISIKTKFINLFPDKYKEYLKYQIENEFTI